MFHINKYIFNEVCEKRMDIYQEFISCIRDEYHNIIKILKNPKTIEEIRFQTHKLVGIISNLHCHELIYICKLILLIDKNDTDISIDSYKLYLKQLIDYDILKIGL
jgi:hypothetical protein